VAARLRCIARAAHSADERAHEHRPASPGVTLSDRDRARLLRDVTRELEELSTLVANIVELARGSQRDLHLEQARLDELAARVIQRVEARFPSLEFASNGSGGSAMPLRASTVAPAPRPDL
jgi:hypothetical protein